ncbi:MAG: beta-galactosidase [Bacteroidota bacterium]
MTRLTTLSPAIILILLCGCQETSQKETFDWEQYPQEVLLDFEEDQLDASLTTEHAAISIETETGVTSGNKALRVSVEGDEKWTGLIYKPEAPINNTQFSRSSLVFDVKNITPDYSVQLFVSVTNPEGNSIRRSVALPSSINKTCYFQLNDPTLANDYGLRDDPAPWGSHEDRMLISGLKYDIDFSQIAQISFEIRHPITDKEIVLDNIRIVESPPIPDDYLAEIVDSFGQNIMYDYPYRITSTKELQELAREELRELEQTPPRSDRSQFGGWKNGPKLEGTGYFRTEKVGDRWAMVDPKGYLFFSTGLANVRLANSTTFTGMDYRDESVRYRDPEDVTPEDSKGMVELSDEVTATAYDAYPWRTKMFQSLPAYDSPLANNYSYRREQHIGPFEHGETFSFYQANLERRYGEPEPGAHLDKWIDVTLDRFLNWGFTSFGNWAAYEFYHENRMPYFANGWVIGDFKTVKSGFDYWGPMPDVFDPEFTRRAKVTVEVVAEEVRDNPWCIGVFIDNEKSWGMPGSVQSEFGIVLYALKKDAQESPIKTEFTRLLKSQYPGINDLNAAWGTSFTSWSEWDTGVDLFGHPSYSDALKADFSTLLEAYATKYFQVVHDALAEVMPNHMYLGCRFASWGMGKEVRAAAQKYVDVFSYNFYEEAIGEKNWEFLAEIDRPALIGEFHMGAMDSGMLHPGIVFAANQEDRARMYKAYMHRVIDNPYFVGAHWFQYFDSPFTGRAHDGENYNVGFVANTDVPYKPLVNAARELGDELYTRRFGAIK